VGWELGKEKLGERWACPSELGFIFTQPEKAGVGLLVGF
jgi:hypothetical protein